MANAFREQIPTLRSQRNCYTPIPEEPLALEAVMCGGSMHA